MTDIGCEILTCENITELYLKKNEKSETQSVAEQRWGYNSSFFFKIICRTSSAILGRTSLTETFGPHTSTTLPFTSMRYFQKFQSGSLSDDSAKQGIKMSRILPPGGC